MKLRTEDLKKTNLGFPSEWKGKCSEGGEVVINYRYGRFKVFHDGKQILETSKDDLDIGGFMDDAEMVAILVKNGLVE